MQRSNLTSTIVKKFGYRFTKLNLYLAFVVLPIACATINDAVHAKEAGKEGTPPHGHVEFALSGSSGAALGASELDRFIALIGEQDLLLMSATATDSPLAPCALLSAAKAAELANMLFWSARQPHGMGLFYPSAGSNILGRYDSDFIRAEGTLSRIKPNKAADILARIIVYHSWVLSTKLNALLSSMTQGECLQLLAKPEETMERMQALDPSKAVLTHAAPVSAYLSTYSRETGNVFLAELLKKGFLARTNTSKGNPFSPCAVLSSFRLAARLNDTWNNQLPKGGYDVASKPELARYAEDIEGIPLMATPSERMAEVFAAVFSAEILRSNELTTQLTGNATEAQCLEEVFDPGTIRKRLMKEGVELPPR